MLKSKIILFTAFVLLFTSCGYKETVTQKRDLAYLKFSKSVDKSYTVLLNDKYTFNLSSCNRTNESQECHDDTSDKIFEVTSGKISIKVFNSDEKIIMDESMYIGSSSTKEIDLP